jgi:hypothetical protein
MRKWVVLAAVAIIVGFVGLPAQAVVNIQPGLNDAHVKDVSQFYRNGVPTVDSPAIGDELRGVFRMDSLQLFGAGTPYWLRETTTGDEVTGLLYDLKVSRIVTDINGNPTAYYFSPLQRNPLVAANDTDGLINTWAGAWGGVVELYQDPTPDLDTTLSGGAGPGLWNTATNPVRPVTGTLADSYPSATDGTLWLSGVLLDLSTFGAGNAGEVYSLIRTGANTFAGTGYLSVFDGYAGSQIADGTMPLVNPGKGMADATIQTTISLGVNVWSNPNWVAGSSDPIEFNSVPEPTIMLLFGASVLGGLIRRRV